MPHVREAKVIEAGKTSHAVILPKDWLRFYKFPKKVKVTSDEKITIEVLEAKKP